MFFPLTDIVPNIAYSILGNLSNIGNLSKVAGTAVPPPAPLSYLKG